MERLLRSRESPPRRRSTGAQSAETSREGRAGLGKDIGRDDAPPDRTGRHEVIQPFARASSIFFRV